MKTSELEHFGVKGMRWGVQRKKVKPSGDSSTATRLSKKVEAGGTKALTNKELKKVIERMKLEKQYKDVSPESPQRKVGKFVGEVMLQAGKNEVSKLVLGQAAKQLPKLLTLIR